MYYYYYDDDNAYYFYYYYYYRTPGTRVHLHSLKKSPSLVPRRVSYAAWAAGEGDFFAFGVWMW
jgi:hypothetical protein